jgi:hypothetical protein
MDAIATFFLYDFDAERVLTKEFIFIEEENLNIRNYLRY